MTDVMFLALQQGATPPIVPVALVELAGAVVVLGWLVAAPFGQPRRSALYRLTWSAIGVLLIGAAVWLLR